MNFSQVKEKFIKFPVRLQGARYTSLSGVGAAEAAVGKQFHVFGLWVVSKFSKKGLAYHQIDLWPRREIR